MPRDAKYAACQGCGHSVCPICEVVDNPLHTGRSCDEFEAVRTCPFPGCTTAWARNACYGQCAGCGHSYCPMCEISDDPVHKDRTCEEYEEMLEEIKSTSHALLHKLVRRALDWGKQNWTGPSPYTRIDPIPGNDIHLNPNLPISDRVLSNEILCRQGRVAFKL